MVNIKNHLMTGISFALPVITAGSLVVVLARIIGIVLVEPGLDSFAQSRWLNKWLHLMQDIGFKIIGLMNYLSGVYVACSISGKRSGVGFLRILLAGYFSITQDSYYRFCRLVCTAHHYAVYYR
ncbi:hypothetical protein [Pantoea sp. SGAir0180]